jgi:proton translocating ATP synthase F1 alpha subunit
MTLFLNNQSFNPLINMNQKNLFASSDLNETQFAVLDAVVENNSDTWDHWWSNELAIDFSSMGQIITVADNVVSVRGLNDVMVGEVVYVLYSYIAADNTVAVGEIIGQALNLNNDGTTGVVLFGDETLILAGNMVFGSGRLLSVSVGASTLGLVVNALGEVELSGRNETSICLAPGLYDETRIANQLALALNDESFVKQLTETGLDWTDTKLDTIAWGRSLATYLKYQWANEMSNVPYRTLAEVETKAPGIIQRSSVNRALYTGIKAIDGLIPIGRGQRELIIGDRQTGKTTIAIDTILRQNTGAWLPETLVYDVFSIYVAVGQKRSFVRQLFTRISQYNRIDSTLIVAATASEPAALQFLAPYTGATFGEAFRDFKKDAVIIYDDLSKHAVAYRQMSLLLRRPPGREAYPGDVFYLHSRLLERAAQMRSGGSLTALPVIETQGGDVTAYIPTNVISITDGQIFLEAEMFHKGIRPAIHMGLSVSRVGSAAQIKAMKQVAGSLKLQLAQFRELESFASFGGELDETTMIIINRGLRLVELLKQAPYRPYDVHWIVCSLYAGSFGFLDSLPVNKVGEFETNLIAHLDANPALVSLLKRAGQVNPVTKRLLTKLVRQLVNNLK